MVKYSNGKIYQICCKDIDVKDIYVGSTTNLNRRRNEHKSCCNNEGVVQYNRYVYQFIRAHGNWGNWDVVMVEEYEATSILDLHKRERYWVEELGATLNKNMPSRDKKEWYNVNKVSIAKKGKEWYNVNKVAISEKKKEYREKNKVAISEKGKEYYREHKVAICEKKKNYREKNKVAISEKRSKKYTCECGSTIRKSSKSQHEKTKKHMKFLK